LNSVGHPGSIASSHTASDATESRATDCRADSGISTSAAQHQTEGAADECAFCSGGVQLNLVGTAHEAEIDARFLSDPWGHLLAPDNRCEQSNGRHKK
jgi:hypothetical protein